MSVSVKKRNWTKDVPEWFKADPTHEESMREYLRVVNYQAVCSHENLVDREKAYKHYVKELQSHINKRLRELSPDASESDEKSGEKSEEKSSKKAKKAKKHSKTVPKHYARAQNVDNVKKKVTVDQKIEDFLVSLQTAVEDHNLTDLQAARAMRRWISQSRGSE